MFIVTNNPIFKDSQHSIARMKQKLLFNNEINCEIIVLDGCCFINEYVDKYFIITRQKEKS